jgi:predicted protein tyrosine phosphatase
VAAAHANFDWVAPDLAVGGSFPPAAAAVIRRHGLGAIIDLRDEACDDRSLLRRARVEFLHLPTPDRCGVSQAMLDSGVDFARSAATANRRLLVHCAQGIGRSATLALCVLVDRGAPPLEALRQAKAARPMISPSPEQYEAWAEWLGRRGATAPSFHEFGCVAYAHLVQGA